MAEDEVESQENRDKLVKHDEMDAEEDAFYRGFYEEDEDEEEDDDSEYEAAFED